MYSEEAQDAERSVPRATYVAVAFLAIFYALSFAVIIYGFGIEGSLAIASDPESAPYLTAISATTYLGGSISGGGAHWGILSRICVDPRRTRCT